MASGKFIKSMFRKKKIFFSVVLVTAVFSYNIFIFLKILWFINHNPKSSAFMEKSIEIIKEKNPGAVIRHKWIPYEKISDNIKKAVIAAEDAKFNYHEGFDWNGIQRAFDMNIKKGKIVAGGSTISQQLAKNLFLSKNRNPFRKAEETIITFMIEKIMGKRRILEIYLNIIEWGEGIFGIEAAADYYFKKNAFSINQKQAAVLAAIIPNPVYYGKNIKSLRIRKKIAILYARMKSAKPPL